MGLQIWQKLRGSFIRTGKQTNPINREVFTLYGQASFAGVMSSLGVTSSLYQCKSDLFSMGPPQSVNTQTDPRSHQLVQKTKFGVYVCRNFDISLFWGYNFPAFFFYFSTKLFWKINSRNRLALPCMFIQTKILKFVDTIYFFLPLRVQTN